MTPEQLAPQSTAAHYVRAFYKALSELGIREEQRDNALRAAQGKHGRFWTNELGPYAMQTFAHALAKEVGDPQLGLRLAQAMPHGANGVVEYAMLSAPTLRATQAVYARYGSLIAEYAQYSLHEQGGYTLIAFSSPSGPVIDRVIEDFRLVRMLSGTRRALSEPEFTPSSVQLTYARPSSLSAYEQAFGRHAAFEFGCGLPGLRVPTSLLDRPLRTSEPNLHAILVQHAEQLLVQTSPTQNLSARVRQVLIGSLHQGRPSIASVAKQLSMSERSLRRHLAEEGSAFAELLDEVRASLSQLLEKTNDRSSKVIAVKLGFESTSALRRAQKRWATSQAG